MAKRATLPVQNSVNAKFRPVDAFASLSRGRTLYPSLAFLIGLADLTEIGKQIGARVMSAPVEVYFTLLVVYFVYRLLERSLGRESAMLGGLLAAAFFAMPVTAVHQLEESVAQVPRYRWHQLGTKSRSGTRLCVPDL